jgi:hypothetical protein
MPCIGDLVPLDVRTRQIDKFIVSIHVEKRQVLGYHQWSLVLTTCTLIHLHVQMKESNYLVQIVKAVAANASNIRQTGSVFSSIVCSFWRYVMRAVMSL